VVLFDPKDESYMGGAIAAPLAGKIIEDVLNYKQVERRYTEDDLRTMTEEVFVPEVRNKTVGEAVKELKSAGLSYKIEGGGNTDSSVLEQTPKPDAMVPENSVVILYTYKPDKEQTVEMPDLSNKTVSEAIEALNRVGLNIKVSGSGVVFKQSKAAGEEVKKGEVVTVEFRNLDNIE
jgi:stage V sporulation protein D (sporulation-specific penicillin-binding protein)